MAVTSRMAPRMGQSFKFRMTWRAKAHLPLHPGPPHLLQGVGGQLAAWAKDRPVILGCKPLQLGAELLLLFGDHTEGARLAERGREKVAIGSHQHEQAKHMVCSDPK